MSAVYSASIFCVGAGACADGAAAGASARTTSKARAERLTSLERFDISSSRHGRFGAGACRPTTGAASFCGEDSTPALGARCGVRGAKCLAGAQCTAAPVVGRSITKLKNGFPIACVIVWLVVSVCGTAMAHGENRVHTAIARTTPRSSSTRRNCASRSISIATTSRAARMATTRRPVWRSCARRSG